ncbi:hypothetical protein HYPSUDRAFT_205030 [Hypholoma sublateritium FD-334 SS-4]|uniref:Uncharacterized protein n=1 Tax=Hypholoma sublateritium (strain FD-334 SS-4) TaxID=945553 RepID=A0A0D2KVW4_HYPSF|nr:hypothetical protein HYPSUDRAFT_205030 [Hypholoma sublateritium FD-334 SS-4]
MSAGTPNKVRGPPNRLSKPADRAHYRLPPHMHPAARMLCAQRRPRHVPAVPCHHPERPFRSAPAACPPPTTRALNDALAPHLATAAAPRHHPEPPRRCKYRRSTSLDPHEPQNRLPSTNTAAAAPNDAPAPFRCHVTHSPMPAPALSPSVATHDPPAIMLLLRDAPEIPQNARRHPLSPPPLPCRGPYHPSRLPTHIDGPTTGRKCRSTPGGPTATFGTTR